MEGTHFFGVDLGGTNLKIGVVEQNGEISHKVKHKIADIRKMRQPFKEAIVDIMVAEFKAHPDIKSAGIGVPGLLSKDRKSLVRLQNLPELNQFPFYDRLKAKLPEMEFYFDNDANAATLGELYFSEDAISDDFLFVTLGTGVGGGFVFDRKIFKGGSGNGGEVGHIISGNGKTVEENIGKKGLERFAAELLAQKKYKSKLPKTPTTKELVKALRDGDEVSRQTFKMMGTVLGEAIVSYVRMLDIDLIVLGGGVSKIFDVLEEPMWAKIHQYLPAYYTSKLKVQVAELRNEAGIIGAAAQCFMEIEEIG